jgi:hypothetical protein
VSTVVEEPRDGALKNSAKFTLRGARSGSMAAGFGIAIVVETVVLHLWLGARHPAWTWSLTVVSVASLAWLVVEYRATRDAAVTVDSELLDLAVGHRFVLRIPRTQVASAVPATWRDVPDAPTAGYLNASAPAQPNVLVTFSSPARVRLLGGLAKRSVTRLGLCLDEPARFIQTLQR